MKATRARGNTKSLRIIFLTLVFASGCMLASVIVSSLPSPFYMRSAVKSNISYFFPQGWAFFTRDARELKLYAFKRNIMGQLKPLSPPGSSYKFYFGLNREGRKIPIEYNSILKQVDTASWSRSVFDLQKIAKQTLLTRPINVENNYYKALACGEIVFIRTQTVPWAWSKYANVKMPSKYVRVYVKCHDKSQDR